MSWSHAGFNRRHVIGLGGHGGISRAYRACCCGAHRRKIAHALLTGYACSGRVCHDPTDPRKARPSRSLDDAARILQHRGISSVCDQRAFSGTASIPDRLLRIHLWQSNKASTQARCAARNRSIPAMPRPFPRGLLPHPHCPSTCASPRDVLYPRRAQAGVALRHWARTLGRAD